MSPEEKQPEMNVETKTNSEKFKYTICYIPFVAIVLFFVEENKTPEFAKHIKYGSFFFIVYVLLAFLFIAIGLGWSIPFVIYIIVSVYFWYKAYSWEKVELEYFDKIEEQIKKKM
jgi:fatty acid desaturase